MVCNGTCHCKPVDGEQQSADDKERDCYEGTGNKQGTGRCMQHPLRILWITDRTLVDYPIGVRKNDQEHGEELKAIEKAQLSTDLAIWLLIETIPIAGYRPGEQHTCHHALLRCFVVIPFLKHLVMPASFQMQIDETTNTGQGDESSKHNIKGQIPGIVCVRETRLQSKSICTQAHTHAYHLG